MITIYSVCVIYNKEKRGFQKKYSNMTLFLAPLYEVLQGCPCTRSRDILVHVFEWMFSGYDSQTMNKLIRYQGQHIRQKINNDRTRKLIFKNGDNSLFMTENNNGDVCVSDRNDNTVVVVGKTGRVRFRYNGAPARREKSFDPRYIVTDALSQIIVTDINDCLNILDHNGH